MQYLAILPSHLSKIYYILYNWGEPERAPHRRVCCGIFLYYILFLVRRAISHLQLIFCVHMSTFNFSWLLTCTPHCLQLIACMKCSVNVMSHFYCVQLNLNVMLHFLLRSVYFVIVYHGFYKHLKLFAEQRRETST